jgi:hypothetical protein
MSKSVAHCCSGHSPEASGTVSRLAALGGSLGVAGAAAAAPTGLSVTAARTGTVCGSPEELPASQSASSEASSESPVPPSPDADSHHACEQAQGLESIHACEQAEGLECIYASEQA